MNPRDFKNWLFATTAIGWHGPVIMHLAMGAQWRRVARGKEP